MDFSHQDIKNLWSSIEQEEKMLEIKKRWLMGLPCSSTPVRSQSHTAVPHVLNNQFLSESLLRDEEVSAEIVRRAIEKGYGALLSKQEEHFVMEDYARVFNTAVDEPSTMYTVIASDLNNLNNIGLCCLANFLTASSIEFEKTRPVMKNLIKRQLRQLFLESSYKKYMESLSQILRNPHNFREDSRACRTLASQAIFFACETVLGKLSEFCTLTLLSMHRKLEGVKYVPQMKSQDGRRNKLLIRKVRSIFSRMLMEQKEGEVLLEPLAKAMTVAALSLKVSGISDFVLPEFLYFSPETKLFQDEILKAIQALPKVKYVHLKHVQHILDPKFEIPKRKFRSTYRKLLMEYLFDCGDLDVPMNFQNTLAFINRKTCQKLQCCLSQEKMEEEVECVLSVSAQLSQLVWNLLPERTFDQEFADAFMGDSESDLSDNDGSDVSEGIRSYNCFTNSHMNLENGIKFSEFHSNEEVQGAGDSRPNVSTLHCMSNGSSANFNSFSDEVPKLEKTNNSYLAIKDVCDEVSLVAHQLIGNLLEAFANKNDVALEQNVRSYLRGGTPSPGNTQGSRTPTKDSDLLLHAVEEIIPSQTKSVSEKLKELGLL